MLNRTENGLNVFDNFNVDYNLPKYAKDISENSDSVYIDNNTSVGGNLSSQSVNWISPEGVSDGSNNMKESFFSKIISFLRKIFSKKPKMSISDFFKAIKNSAIDVEKYSNRVNDYLNALNHAKKNNQDALVSELTSRINEVKLESILYAGGFTKVITEEQVVKFYKECKKGLELTWIRNFIRVIPEKATEKKEEANELKVFDNFVILHYDIDKKAYKEEDKDPILFGVVKGSRKLYYIADWIDEYCDLTLEQFIDKFGNDAITANDITVNFKLK